MKNLILAALILALAIPCFAADEFLKDEARPDVAKYIMRVVQFNLDAPQCDVIFDRVDAEGNPAAGAVVITFVNIPEVLGESCEEPVCTGEGEEEVCEPAVCTPIVVEESKPEFNQLISLINNNDNIKQSIISAVQIKLGL